jgi:hypothetical protein
MKRTLKNFKQSVGNEIYNKLLIAIFKTQSELIRSYNLDISPDIIKIDNDKITWNIIGHESDSDKLAILHGNGLDISNKIREFAINELRNSRILHGNELSELVFLRSKESSTCILICKKEKLATDKYTIWSSIARPFIKIWDYIIKMFEYNKY